MSSFGSSAELVIMKMNERKKKKKDKNKRRFSDEQIKSLETIFESESKLEPMKKLQLARELGLHPRQIAIWFQNRRARWKSKQLERDYSLLRDNYDDLASKFESLKKEKQSLVVQVQKLNEVLEKQQGRSSWRRFDLVGNSTEGDSDNGDPRYEAEAKSSSPQLEEEEGKIPKRLGQEEPELNMVEPQNDSLTSPENFCSFNSADLFGRSSNDSEWWDFWN